MRLRAARIIVGKKTGQVYYTKFVRGERGFAAVIELEKADRAPE